MKCHYITDKEIGKLLIPGCWGVAIHYDIDFCHCPNHQKSRIEILEDRISKLEKLIVDGKNIKKIIN